MSNHFKKAVLAFFVGLFCCSSICFAQDSSVPEHTKAGVLLSKGSNKSYSGKLKVTTYRLELIKLAQPINLNDGQPPLETAFRIVIKTALRQPMSNLNIILDENAVQAVGIRNNEYAAVILARTLTNGLKLSLAEWEEEDASEYSVLPERLEVPAEYATSPEQLAAEMPVVRLRLIGTNRAVVQLTISVPPIRCRLLNDPFIIEIDGKARNINCIGDLMETRFTMSEFKQLSDGAEIVVKRGRGKRRAGTLNKSLLEQ